MEAIFFSMLKVTKCLYFNSAFIEYPNRPDIHYLQKILNIQKVRNILLNKKVKTLANLSISGFSLAFGMHRL